MQDVFVVVHRRLPDFEGRRALRTWLVRILLNVVREHRRRFRRKEHHGSLPGEVVDANGPSPHEECLRSEAAALLGAILDAMQEDQREVFVLAEMEQIPVPEIAETLSLPLNTVYSRLRLARRDYQRHLVRLRARETWNFMRARKRSSTMPCRRSSSV